MRIAVLLRGYPSEPTPCNYAFVQMRARLCTQRGPEVVAERHRMRRYPNAEVIPNWRHTDLFPCRADPANRTRGMTTRSLSRAKCRIGIGAPFRAFVGRERSLDIPGRGSVERQCSHAAVAAWELLGRAV